MGLISPGGEYLLDFLELQQVPSTYDRDLKDPLWWPQERPVPMLVARRPLRIPLPSMPGAKILFGLGAGTRGFLSSADMDLGVLWSLHRRTAFFALSFVLCYLCFVLLTIPFVKECYL